MSTTITSATEKVRRREKAARARQTPALTYSYKSATPAPDWDPPAVRLRLP
jgi:hypothetical protein